MTTRSAFDRRLPDQALLHTAPRRSRATRSMALLLALLTASEPLLAAAPSLIAQEPLFVRAVVQPNVMLVIDDSQSMSTYQLPPPTWLPLYQQKRINGWDQGTMQIADGSSVARDRELIFRGAAYNPLWYNPAVQYKPWNDNGNSKTFPQASWGGSGTEAVPGQWTERDMRFEEGTTKSISNQVGRGTIGPKDWSVKVSGNTFYYNGVWGEHERDEELFTRPRTKNMGCDPATYKPAQCQPGQVRKPIYGPKYCVVIPADNASDPPRPSYQDCERRDIIGWTQPTDSDCATMSKPVCNWKWDGTYTYHKIAARYYRPQLNEDPRNPKNSVELVEIDRAKPRDYSIPANRYLVIDAVTGELGKREDCRGPGQDGTWCTFEQEAQNFANWYLYYRTRLFAAIAVISHALADIKSPQDGMRLGYGRINLFKNAPDPFNINDNIGALPDIDGMPNPGAIVRGVRPFIAGTADRQQVFDWLFTLQAIGGTPNREAVDSVGRYFSRNDSKGPWADYPGSTAGRVPAQHISCRRSFTMLATDGGWTNSTYQQPSLEAVAGSNSLNWGGSTALTADGVTGPTMKGDGPNAGDTYRYVASENPQFYGASPPAGDQTGTLSDVSMFYWNRDLRPDLPNSLRPSTTNPAYWQHMSNLVIGYGLNSTMNTAEVREQISKERSVAWPLVDMNPALSPSPSYDGQRVNDTFRAAMNSRGEFFSATNPEQLRTSIKSAFDNVNEQTSSGTAIAAPSAAVRAGDMVYTTNFMTSKWHGTLYAYDAIDLLARQRAGTGLPEPRWESTIEPWDKRQALLWTSTGRNTAVPFKYNSLTTALRDQLGEDDTERFMNFYWLIGYRAWEAPSGPQRARTTLLGDIVNSNPLYSKAPDQAYQFGPAAAVDGGAGYRKHVSDNIASRKATVFVGANDGMFHAFDALTGKERWAYVPRAVYPYLALLPRPGYQHRYYVDGPTIQGDMTGADGKWKTVVVGSTGAGAPGLFAIDVTDPGSMDSSKVLWDLTGDDDGDLGSVIGTGAIGSTKDGKWVAIMPNGYESKGNRAVLMVIDLKTGEIRKIDTKVGSNAKPNGLGSVTPVYDRSRNIVAVYAGDKLGNLWKFDLSSTKPGDWKITTVGNKPLFQATDAAGVGQPITTAPRITLHPLGGYQITFGTGKFFETNDTDSKQVQEIYQLWERPQALGEQIDNSKIRRMSWTEKGDVRQMTGTPVNWQTDLGWSVALASEGERVIASPSIDGAAITLVSFVPNAIGDPCIGGGQSWLYVIDLPSGSMGGQRIGGIVGGLSQLQELPPEASAQNTMDRAKLSDMMAGRFAGGDGAKGTSSGRALAKQLAGRPNCLRTGLQIDSSVVSVARECTPMLPMRMYREVRP